MADEKPPTGPVVIKRNMPRGKPFQKGPDDRRHLRGPLKKREDGTAMTVAARQMCPEVLDFWHSTMRNEGVPWRERIKAGELIYQRAYGAATTVVDINASVHHRHEVSTVDFSSMDQELRKSLLAALQALPVPDDVDDGEYTLLEDHSDGGE